MKSEETFKLTLTMSSDKEHAMFPLGIIALIAIALGDLTVGSINCSVSGWSRNVAALLAKTEQQDKTVGGRDFPPTLILKEQTKREE
jgi:hypothetical protein